MYVRTPLPRGIKISSSPAPPAFSSPHHSLPPISNHNIQPKHLFPAIHPPPHLPHQLQHPPDRLRRQSQRMLPQPLLREPPRCRNLHLLRREVQEVEVRCM